MKKIKVVMADDHPLFRRGVREALETDSCLQIIGEASDGNEALQMILKEEPDVAVLDINMPHLTGLKVAEELKSKDLKTEIVFLTMFDDEDILNEAMELGVKAYILKESAAIDIVNAVKMVNEGHNYISPSLTAKLLTKKKTKDKIILGLNQLTLQELNVLKLIAESKSTKDIAESLSLSPKTIENHRYKISEKLNLSGSYSLLKFALQNKDVL